MKAETLRKSILQYAIQGKLVSQIETEEPASKLLKKIKAEKQDFIKQGKIKKEKPLPPITDGEKPFDIPDSWEWVRLCEVANLFTGNSVNAQEKKKNYTDLIDGYNYIATKDVRFDSTINYENGIKIPFNTDFKIAKKHSSLLCIEGGSAGRKVGKVNQDVCFGNKLCSFEPIIIDQDYLFYYIQSPIFTENFTGNKSGIIGGVGINTLKALMFILPPFSEQKRIVARIGELMALVDEYEKKEIELSKLEKEFPEKLKKSILQHAIQGKLVSQIGTEEPASEMLKKMKAEKQELIKQGKIKNQKYLHLITDDEKPFDIPESWEWCKLVDVLLELPRNGFSPNRSEKQTNTKVLTLSATTKGVLDLSKFKYIDEAIDENSYLRLQYGDILIQRSNSAEYVGVSCLYDSKEDGYIFPDLMMKIRVILHVDIKYILFLLKSPYVRQYFKDNASGTSDTMKKITQGIVSNIYFPLPPLAEQQRIVSRIEELFALVDALVADKKLPEKQTKIDANNVINLSTAQKSTHKVDVSFFDLVARKDSEIIQDDVDSALQEVQDYYDNKNN